MVDKSAIMTGVIKEGRKDKIEGVVVVWCDT